MSRLYHAVLIAAFGISTASCSREPASGVADAQPPVRTQTAPGTKTPEPADGTTPAPQQDALEFGRRIGVQCKTHGAQVECSGGKPENGEIYDVELMPSCGPDGFFGGVVEKPGADLRDALAPNDERTVATLAQGQIVCIQAVARAGQQPAYYYASTIPTSAIAACKGNHLCDLYGDRKVHVTGQPTPCPSPSHQSDCAAGWIDADTIEAFENGM